jgi:zinc transport system permease protein
VELAWLSGVDARGLESVLLVTTAVVVVTAIQAVGVILVGSFIVLPAATARLLFRSLTGVAAGALVFGTAGCALGLLASYHLNVASGATIILTLALGFGAALWRPTNA